MALLDDQGRVFGVVNVIDLLAVLLAVAVVVAGAALVFSGGSSDRPDLGTRYVTIDLGNQPPYVTERIGAGDVGPVTNSPDNLTVTDVYVAPSEQASTVTVRARVTGQFRESSGGSSVFTFKGEPLLLGRDLTVETDEYRVSGVVTDVSRRGDSLQTATTDVLLSTTVPVNTASLISVGDRYRTNGQTLATVESVTVYPANDPTNRRVHLGLSLRTITRQDQPRFGGQRIGIGRSLSVTLGRYDVTGRVTQVGHSSLPGEVTTTTAVVKLSNVPPERADNVRGGLTETIGNTQYAEVIDVRTEPSEVVLTSQYGNISLQEHPRNVDLYLTVELRTRRTSAGLTFHGTPLRLNDRVVLEFEIVTIRGDVIGIRR
ncbi:MAG: DUF4330 family protein [Haloplanus sp.]